MKNFFLLLSGHFFTPALVSHLIIAMHLKSFLLLLFLVLFSFIFIKMKPCKKNGSHLYRRKNNTHITFGSFFNSCFVHENKIFSFMKNKWKYTEFCNTLHEKRLWILQSVIKWLIVALNSRMTMLLEWVNFSTRFQTKVSTSFRLKTFSLLFFCFQMKRN